MTADELRVPALAAVAVAAAVMVATGWAAGRARRRIESGTGTPGTGLSMYELAYLAGGPRRVVNAILTARATGPEAIVEVSGDGRLRLIGDDAGLPPVERAVVAQLRVQRHVGAVRRSVAFAPAMSALRHRLTGLGLLVGDDGLRRIRGWLRLRQLVSAVALPPPVLYYVALANAGRSVSVLGWALAMAVTGVGFVGLVSLVTATDDIGALHHVRTAAGTATLESARRDGAAGPGIRVALDGAEVLAEGDLRSGLLRRDVLPPGSRRDYASVGWLVDSDGGGDGGGGDGGGAGGGGDGGGG